MPCGSRARGIAGDPIRATRRLTRPAWRGPAADDPGRPLPRDPAAPPSARHEAAMPRRAVVRSPSSTAMRRARKSSPPAAGRPSGRRKQRRRLANGPRYPGRFRPFAFAIRGLPEPVGPQGPELSGRSAVDEPTALAGLPEAVFHGPQTEQASAGAQLGSAAVPPHHHVTTSRAVRPARRIADDVIKPNGAAQQRFVPTRAGSSGTPVNGSRRPIRGSSSRSRYVSRAIADFLQDRQLCAWVWGAAHSGYSIQRPTPRFANSTRSGSMDRPAIHAPPELNRERGESLHLFSTGSPPGEK